MEPGVEARAYASRDVSSDEVQADVRGERHALHGANRDALARTGGRRLEEEVERLASTLRTSHDGGGGEDDRGKP